MHSLGHGNPSRDDDDDDEEYEEDDDDDREERADMTTAVVVVGSSNNKLAKNEFRPKNKNKRGDDGPPIRGRTRGR